MVIRSDGRAPADLRPLNIVPGFIRNNPGSVLIELGDTRVICTATIENDVPAFLRDRGQGWITAEYGMLPGSSTTRIARESTRGRVGGRTHEIQRLIGRSLRAVVDLGAIGQRTIWVDCDVIQADGGTRTAAITGSYVAVVLALRQLRDAKLVVEDPVTTSVAAVSIGIVDGIICLDLSYEEDSRAEVDMNFVVNGDGKFIEVQGTAENKPFTFEQLSQMSDLAGQGIRQLAAHQRAVLALGTSA